MNDLLKQMFAAALAVKAESATNPMPIALLLTADDLRQLRSTPLVDFGTSGPGVSFQGLPVYSIRGQQRSSSLMADGTTKPL